MSLASVTRTWRTTWPLMSRPSICSAAAWASSGPLASLTPPALPRPPVFTCALTTTWGVPAAANSAAISRAPAGSRATRPGVTSTPYFANSSFAWYSNRSTRVCPHLPRRSPGSADPGSPLWGQLAGPRLAGSLTVAARGAASGCAVIPGAVIPGGTGRGAELGVHPVHDLLGGRAGREDPRDAHPLELRDVGLRDDAAAEHRDIGRVLLGQQLDHPGEQRHVRAGQDRQPDRGGVLLDRRRHDLLRRLVQPGVDDLDPGITQGPGDHLRAAVVAVQPGLRDDHADAAHSSIPAGCLSPRPSTLVDRQRNRTAGITASPGGRSAAPGA